MQPENLNVFDFDGTLINVNSFKEISKKFSLVLLRKLQVVALFRLIRWYIIRKLNLIPHLQFKQQVVNIFEEALSEKEKRNITQAVFDSNINENVFELMLNTDNCIISTAAPYAYVSRISFAKVVVVLTSLAPHNNLPDPANYGSGKVENIKAYFMGEDIRVTNFYTDSVDDQAMVEFSQNAYMVKRGLIEKIK
jgi:phosphoserine phosphatase